MDFFQQQDRARSSTARLVLLFVLAIVLLIVLTSYPLALLYATAQAQQQGIDPASVPFRADIFGGVAAVIISVVLLGSLYRTSQLRSGGRAIAESLRGRLLTPGSEAGADERKVLNVVEEMAIAAGLPVPPVYLIEDDAINAFAAGYHQQDAVIGITRGAIQLLERDELQGVIAHEFSHIFNGDMRLNLRLVGWLHGLLLIALLGRALLRMRRLTSRQRDKAAGGIVGLGIAFVVLGYTGVFFGNLIKSAVSRQREFLADASAVQFTRNTDGIGNALKKIGGFALGSRLLNQEVAEISHMLFGEGVRQRNGAGWFATHPPLEKRIRRIDPRWDGSFIDPRQPRQRTGSEPPPERQPGANLRNLRRAAVLADTIAETVGTLSQQGIADSRAQLDALAPELKQQTSTAHDAMLLMYAVVIAAANAEVSRAQLAQLQQQLSATSFKLLAGQLKLVRAAPPSADLLLVELSQPALRQLSPTQLADFLLQLQQLVDSDGELTLAEWSLCALLRHYLLVPGTSQHREPVSDISARADDCKTLLAALSQNGRHDVESAAAAFAAGITVLKLPPAQYRRVEDYRLLDGPLGRLRALKPLQKPALLKAMVACVQHDGHVADAEMRLLRVVAAMLDCPLPPL